MATTYPTTRTTLPFYEKAVADLVDEASFALDCLAGMGVAELPRPLSYWASEFRALLAALADPTPGPRSIPGLLFIADRHAYP